MIAAAPAATQLSKSTKSDDDFSKDIAESALFLAKTLESLQKIDIKI